MDVKLLVVAAFACSGNKTAPKTAVEDAKAGSAQPVDAMIRIDPSVKGDVQIRVEWKDVPVAARASPGRTTCGTARPAAVAPTTTWGVPDVFVAIEVPGSGSGGAHRIVFGDCLLTPRALTSTGTLTIASATQAPAKLTIQRAGQLPLGSAIKEDKARDVYLPIAGHEVEVALDAGAIYRVAAGDELGWVVATDHPFIALTEVTGNIVLRGVPGGTHAITAWLPPRSGQPARVAKGTVTVNAGALSEVTLDITKQ
ncbi:MAG TPA: hypothetical protein VIV11_27165 [Kofleriaceae bacterium]